MQTITSTGNATSYSVGAALDDLSLVHACKQGDVNAFDQIVKRYDNKLFRVAQHITHNREDAEDAVQNAFLNAFRNLRSFQEKSQFSTWLFRIATHLALNSLRDGRNERLQERLDDDSNDMPVRQVSDRRPSVEQSMVYQAKLDEVRQAISALPEKQRAAVLMHKYEEMEYSQIAKVLSCSESAVKSLLFRAYETLRMRLAHMA